jgi:hypothetical protein
MSYEPEAFRKALREEKKYSTYDDLVDEYGVNRYYLWNIINKDGYLPPLRICLILDIEIPQAKVVPMNGRQIPDGSQALMALRCDCGQYFISNHPRRRKCYKCSPYRGKR